MAMWQGNDVFARQDDATKLLDSIGGFNKIDNETFSIDNFQDWGAKNASLLNVLSEKGYKLDVDPSGNNAVLFREGNWFQKNAGWLKPTMDLTNFGVGLFNTWQNYLNAKTARSYMKDQKKALLEQLRMAKEEWELRKKASGFSDKDLQDAANKAKV